MKIKITRAGGWDPKHPRANDDPTLEPGYVSPPDPLDELIEIVERCGGAVTLYGIRATSRDLRSFAWSGFVSRYVDQIIAAAARELAIRHEPQWTPYP